MTGEVSLRGHVLPVGGVREKVSAAHRAGLKRVLLPAQNESHLHDVPPRVRDALTVIFVRELKDVVREALVPLPAPGAALAAAGCDDEATGTGRRDLPDGPTCASSATWPAAANEVQSPQTPVSSKL